MQEHARFQEYERPRSVPRRPRAPRIARSSQQPLAWPGVADGLGAVGSFSIFRVGLAFSDILGHLPDLTGPARASDMAAESGHPARGARPFGPPSSIVDARSVFHPSSFPLRPWRARTISGIRKSVETGRDLRAPAGFALRFVGGDVIVCACRQPGLAA
jgi:hypothetical protein